MLIKSMNVFYGADCLPYKDKELTPRIYKQQVRNKGLP